jgi:VanZ family protein
LSLRAATLSRGLLAAVALLGLALSLRPLAPGAGPENWFAGADKLFHLVFFTLLWCLAQRARLGGGWRLGLGLLLFGAMMELAQGALTVSRSASWADLLADGVGLLLGAALTRWTLVGQPKEDGR